MLTYKGYTARIEFDDNAEIFHGQVIGTRDVITFQATSVKELRAEFHHSVDDYLEFCATRKEQPDRPFSGRIALRIESELHRHASDCAARVGLSLNSWISAAIGEAVARPLLAGVADATNSRATSAPAAASSRRTISASRSSGASLATDRPSSGPRRRRRNPHP